MRFPVRLWHGSTFPRRRRLLAVSDSLIVGAHAGSIYLLARSGVTTASELQESVKRMQQAGLSASGVLFNDLNLRPGGYGYPYQYGRQRPAPLRWAGRLKAPQADAEARAATSDAPAS